MNQITRIYGSMNGIENAIGFTNKRFVFNNCLIFENCVVIH